MTDFDEPILSNPDDKTGHADASAVERDIRELIESQRYAVLCTQAEAQPYGTLVAYAANRALTHLVFSTPVTTRKYRQLSECRRVAMLIDSRHGADKGLMEIAAVTATGTAEQVHDKSDFAEWAELLTDKHHYLESFVRAETCALFVIEVVRYFHVSRFQEVSQWLPKAPSR